MSEKIFPEGIIFKRPREGAPAFVRGSLSIKVDEAVAFLQKHMDSRGWVNLDLLNSKENKLYFQLNQWKKPGEEGKLTDPVEIAKVKAVRDAAIASQKAQQDEIEAFMSDSPF